MTTWKPVDERAFSERMQEIALEAELEAIGDSMCANCGDPIAGDSVWIERRYDPDGETREAFYCSRCISKDDGRAL